MVIEGMAFPAQKQFPWKKFFYIFPFDTWSLSRRRRCRWRRRGPLDTVAQIWQQAQIFFSEWHTKKENDVFDDSSLSIIKDCFWDCWIKMADAFIKMI